MSFEMVLNDARPIRGAKGGFVGIGIFCNDEGSAARRKVHRIGHRLAQHTQNHTVDTKQQVARRMVDRRRGRFKAQHPPPTHTPFPVPPAPLNDMRITTASVQQRHRK